MIKQEIGSESANGLAVDFGLLRQVGKSMSLGLSVRNLGSQMKFEEEQFNMPLTVSAGTSFPLFKSVTLSADMHARPHDENISFALGSEIIPIQGIALRAGYLAKLAETLTNNQQSESDRGDFSGLGGFTGGLGLSLKQFNLDYAFSPMGEQGARQTFTFSMKFGR